MRACALHVGKGVLCMGMRVCMDVCTCVYVYMHVWDAREGVMQLLQNEQRLEL